MAEELTTDMHRWVLDSRDALFACAAELATHGFRGSVQFFRPTMLGERAAEVVWVLEVVEDVDAPQQPPTLAQVGDQLDLVFGMLRVTPGSAVG